MSLSLQDHLAKGSGKDGNPMIENQWEKEMRDGENNVFLKVAPMCQVLCGAIGGTTILRNVLGKDSWFH